jgi:hypothetical protein
MVTMKKGVTIFLLVSMVSLQTPVGQLLKLPLLIEHFIKHQQQDGVSLLAYLQDHYSEDHHDADLPEDEQLPFKKHHRLSNWLCNYARSDETCCVRFFTG